MSPFEPEAQKQATQAASTALLKEKQAFTSSPMRMRGNMTKRSPSSMPPLRHVDSRQIASVTTALERHDTGDGSDGPNMSSPKKSLMVSTYEGAQ